MADTYGSDGFTVIQFSDIHQNQRGELAQIAEFAQRYNIDFGFFCGDAVGENHSLSNNVGLEYDLLEVANNHENYEDLDAKVEETIKAAYGETTEGFQAIKDALSQGLFGVLGNHDLTTAYDVLDSVTWVDNQDPIFIEINGKRIAIGGNRNTYEQPGYEGEQFAPLKEHLKTRVAYNLTRDNPKFVNALEVAELFQAYIDDKETLKTNNLEAYTQLEQLVDENKFDETKTTYDNIASQIQTERERLEKLRDADAAFLLSHKIAHSIYGSGKNTLEVASYENVKSIHGGHMHGGEVFVDGKTISVSDITSVLYQEEEGLRTIVARIANNNMRNGINQELAIQRAEQYLTQLTRFIEERATTETIEGEEIAVFYIGDSKPEFNSGDNHFAIHKYNNDANWEYSDLMRYSA